MLQLVTALKLITVVVIECAVVTWVTLSVVRRLLSDRSPRISREASGIATDGFIEHKPQNRNMPLISQLAQLQPRFVQLHGRTVCSVCSCSCPSKQTS